MVNLLDYIGMEVKITRSDGTEQYGIIRKDGNEVYLESMPKFPLKTGVGSKMVVITYLDAREIKSIHLLKS